MASAQLTALVDQIVTELNTAPLGTWSGLTVGTTEDDFVKATPTLDPENSFENSVTGLYITPITMMYNRAESRGRPSIVQLQRSPSIAICLGYRFQTADESGLDVSSWEKVKEIMALREEIDLYLLRKAWGWNIAEINAEPAQELPLKSRYFLAITEIEFAGMTC